MKSVIIHNTIDITNYTIAFTLEFILYSNNSRIREMSTMNIEQLSAFQIPFVFENLTSGKVIIKNIIIASNNSIITDNFGLQVFCCFNKESLVLQINLHLYVILINMIISLSHFYQKSFYKTQTCFYYFRKIFVKK
tara:strand:- start:583 stop:990 length:408 start_codon:yes stop_codon:yes gene_type:complete